MSKIIVNWRSISNYLSSRMRQMVEPKVRPGLVRIRWTCQCGLSSFDDFYETQPNSGLLLMEQLQIMPRSVAPSVLPTHEPRRSGSAMPTSNAQLRPRHQASGGQPQSSQTNSVAQNSTGLQQTAVATADLDERSAEGSYILACVNGDMNQPAVIHLGLQTRMKDRDIFSQLRRHYCRARGPWKRWLSLWSLSSIHFIQFEVFPHHLINVRKLDDLPPEDPHHKKIYKFAPRPPDVSPPLGPNFLSHRIQYPEHAGDIDRCCEQFPKKLLGAVATGDIAWGLQFNEGLNNTRISIVCIAIFVSSTVVGCVVSKVSGNLQSGFALGSYLLTALALGVCSVQLAVESKLTKL